MSQKKNSRLYSLSMLALLWPLSGAVMAFPCAMGYVDGSPTTDPILDSDGIGDNYSCVDGAAGDQNDSAADLDVLYPGDLDWVYIDRYNIPNTLPGDYDGGTGPAGVLSIDNLYIETGNDILAGNWHLLSNLWATYDEVAIVVKDGRFTPPEDGVYWTAYLVEADDLAGDWSMPSKSLSHMTVYARRDGGGPPTGTPVPAPLALMGIGGLLIGYVGRKRLR